MATHTLPLFHDRRDAGRRLAERLTHLRARHPLVLALPRGGVPVAHEIARALDAPLDLLLVRKLGAPQNPEFGIGAVADGAEPQLVLNAEMIRQTGASPDYLRQELQRQMMEMKRRRALYCGGRAAPAVEDRCIILVDDGVATGGTVEAALKALRQARAGYLVLAVPVGPADTLRMLRSSCDEIVCLETPEPFFAVGLHYGDFTQVDDDEVRALMALATDRADGRG